MCFRAGSVYAPRTRGRAGGDRHEGVSKVLEFANGETEHLSAEGAPVARCSAALSAKGKRMTPHSDFRGLRRAGSLPTSSAPLHCLPHAPRPPAHVGTASKGSTLDSVGGGERIGTVPRRRRGGQGRKRERGVHRAREVPRQLPEPSERPVSWDICSRFRERGRRAWAAEVRTLPTTPILAILGAGYLAHTRVPFRPGFLLHLPPRVSCRAAAVGAGVWGGG